MAHIICVSSQKGGTGKTTTAVNLAASLAVFEQRTLLVDCDPLGNATTNLGIDKKGLSLDLYHALVGEADIQAVILESNMAYLQVLPARFGLFRAETKLSSTPNRERALRSLLGNCAHAFDYIIVDSPASFGYLSLCAMVSADWLLIPLQFQVHAFEGLSHLLHIVQNVRRTIHSNLKISGILFTMCDEPEIIRKSITTGALKQFKENIFSTIIQWDDLFRDASNLTKPLVLHDIMSRGAQAYLKLAKEIIHLLKPGRTMVDKKINE